MNRQFLPRLRAYIVMSIAICLLFYFTQSIQQDMESNSIIDKPINETIVLDYTPQEQAYTDFKIALDKDEVTHIYYTDNATYFYATENGITYLIDNPQTNEFKQTLLEKGFVLKPFKSLVTANDLKNYKVMLCCVLFGCIFMTVCVYRANKKRYELQKKQAEQASELFDKELQIFGDVIPMGPKIDVGKGHTLSDEDRKDGKKYTFADVAGLNEVKEDMKSLVDFLINKEKYVSVGANLPKGVILYGPPGTGKTLLARAVAGEADVPFLYMNGSDFEEKLVGVGAKRVRELFDEAREKAPCIVFIDEIDAVGSKRSNYTSSDGRQTLNALLTEMDGFKQSDNILVIAATNRIEDLDSALVRAGRFTNKYCVPLPSTWEERLEVINMYVKNKNLAEDIDLTALAKETVGFSPAQIESLLNEAAIISVQRGQLYIDKAVLEEAIMKMLLDGHIRKDQTGRSADELKIVAWHEAGHTLVNLLLNKTVNKVTILSSTSGAGGVTVSTPEKERLLSVQDLKNRVMELYGGRIAEFLLFGDKTKITTGASNDIARATEIIHDFITSYGMDDSFGLLNLENLEVPQEVLIEKEVALAKELESATINLLTDNKEMLGELAVLLLENETLYESDLAKFLKKFENMVDTQ